ncbi:MAG: hypothetical protein WC603_01605 [Candidatus Paceibacterota bacterium]|jgi:quinol-cytochrome oxidoreductase complex cytochrome b subunit
MKISFKKTENQIKKLFSPKKSNPHTDWRILLDIFFLVVVVLILFSFYLLYTIKNQQVFQIEPKSDETPTMINEKLLEKINNSFEQKSIKAREIKDGSKSYKDPSIN